MFTGTPLAWLNLKHDLRRLAAAVAGICFAVLLMFMETGFMYALFDSTVKLVDDADADLVLVSPARYVLAAEKRFPLARLNQVRSVAGVAAVYPVYIERSMATLRPLPRGVPQPVRVIGTPSASEAFDFDDRRLDASEAGKLHRPQAGLIDDRSKRAMFGFALGPVSAEAPARAELSGKPVDIIGRFSLGTDFASDGTLLLSDANLARYFPWRNAQGQPLAAVDVGFVKLAPGADSDATVSRIGSVLGNEVTVLTKAAYRQREVDFWKANTPVGMIFQIGTWMGFVVGVIICYQVLYTDISDHLKEYATLKAMGYRSGYFVRLVLAESVILSVMGFVPGVLASWMLYTWLGVSTGLLMKLTLGRAGIVLVLTVAMCIVSGLFALRKLLLADPAELF